MREYNIFRLLTIWLSATLTATSVHASCKAEATAYVNGLSIELLEELATCLEVENKATANSCSDQAALYAEEQSEAMSASLRECVSATPVESQMQTSPVIKDIIKQYETFPNIEASDPMDRDLMINQITGQGDKKQEIMN